MQVINLKVELTCIDLRGHSRHWTNPSLETYKAVWVVCVCVCVCVFVGPNKRKGEGGGVASNMNRTDFKFPCAE